MQLTIEPLLNETFGDNDDVYGVVMYALSTMKVNQAIARGLATESSEVTGVGPKELETMRRYDNGLVTNRFYQENFAPIKAQLALNDIKFRSMGFLVTYHLKERRDDVFMDHAKAVMLTYVDVFTTIAMLWKGVEFAETFDCKLRSLYKLDPLQAKFFKDNG